MVRLKRDLDAHALFRSDAALYWYHTEYTQPAEILDFCGIQEQKILLHYISKSNQYHISFELQYGANFLKTKSK